MKARKLMVFMILAALMALTAACGNSQGAGSKSNGKNSSNSASGKMSGKIVVAGSTALQPLVSAAAKAFMQKHPGVQIQVEGGGSGTGLSEVSQGHIDIGDSDIFAQSKKGIPAGKLVDHKVAVVGMTAAVNPKAGVKNLTKQQLIKIFTGKIKNWKQVGGNNVKITVVNRPVGSGTRATFEQFAINGKTPAQGITQSSSNTVRQIIAQTPGAIGYEAFSYFKGSNSIVKLSINGVKATDQNVESGKFPVWAYEHMYTKGQPNAVEKAFLNFMMSGAVQNKLVPAQGYIPVTKMKVQRDAKGNTMKK